MKEQVKKFGDFVNENMKNDKLNEDMSKDLANKIKKIVKYEPDLKIGDSLFKNTHGRVDGDDSLILFDCVEGSKSKIELSVGNALDHDTFTEEDYEDDKLQDDLSAISSKLYFITVTIDGKDYVFPIAEDMLLDLANMIRSVQ